MTDVFEKQLRDIVDEYRSNKSSENRYDEFHLRDLQTRCVAAVERVVGRHSSYFEKIREIEKIYANLYDQVPEQVAVVNALLSDIEKGNLRSLEEIIRADLFADYLEMATHLAENGYKDPAAVLAGSTLEAHLRNLCGKHGVATMSGTGKLKKADTLNADLKKAGVYNQLDQKDVTAWLDIRNKAAHGEFDEYTLERVEMLINSLRDFIKRHPA